MTMILHPIVTEDGRLCWDKRLSPLIVAWLRMMQQRLERQLSGIMRAKPPESAESYCGHSSTLRITIHAIGTLIYNVENSWDQGSWGEAIRWVESILEMRNDNPTSTDQASNEIGGSISPGPGTGRTTD